MSIILIFTNYEYSVEHNSTDVMHKIEEHINDNKETYQVSK